MAENILTAPIWCKSWEVKNEPHLCASLSSHYNVTDNNNVYCGCCEYNGDLDIFKDAVRKLHERFVKEHENVTVPNDYNQEIDKLMYIIYELVDRLKHAEK